MKKIFILSILFLSILGFASCDHEEIATYSGTDSVYFAPSVFGISDGATTTITDSIGFTFALEKPEIVGKTYNIPVRVQGDISDIDRKVKLVVDPKSTAIAGTHFEIPQDFVIPAGKVVTDLPVKVFRTADMKKNGFLLILNLEENESFKTEMKSKEINVLTHKRISFITFKLSFDDKLTQPIGWYASSLGVFSAKKFFLMCDLIHLDPVIFNQKLGGPGLAIADFMYYQAFMKRYLADQKASGNTIYEEDGKEMIFP
ncbi:DUF4843 domain-containing protein [Flavobacterium zhairuonense]|uniref:DUF4843 domain-containing protein n=1 Tax=Flavobacterium zhairuonense TaxID=2493631 RepID=UPI0013C2FAAA|nr:DUF4843 domain-containing protein [Flavobacterium zhairuonense]KAF2509443.1 DUF4843 domain-containing protein [Flavobacterium zhairuonense]